jgi:uncharacterized protein YhbP (UPF0306 family)
MERMRELLESISTMTLATTDLLGNPHAASVYFVSVDIEGGWQFYFFSDENSQHSHHVAQNPKTAAAIYPECQGWSDIKGLQLLGETRLVESKVEWNFAWAHYQDKFPFVRSMKTVVAQNRMYVFIPNWIRLLDNSRGFGYKKEWRQSSK